MEVTSSSWLEIDLDAIKYNLEQVQDKLEMTTDIMAIVKANAYGHGAVAVAETALQAGASSLGVATVQEGRQLRQAGIEAPILILGTLFPEQIQQVIEYNLMPTVYTYQLAKQLSEAGSEVNIHLKLDTGMGRIGLQPDQAVAEIRKIAQLPNLKLTGIFTHFSQADTDVEYTTQQLETFEAIVAKLQALGIEIPIRHTANSVAIVNYPATHYNLVRMGLLLYGLYPSLELANKIQLQPALTWKAKIANLKEVPPGRSISYGGTYVTSTPTKVATLPVGYHDGYPRNLSDTGEVLYQGQRYPVIGRICMDQLMVDLTGAQAEVGDVVTLLGAEGAEEIPADELADKLGTINYEVVSRVGPRIPRLFYENG